VSQSGRVAFDGCLEYGARPPPNVTRPGRGGAKGDDGECGAGEEEWRRGDEGMRGRRRAVCPSKMLYKVSGKTLLRHGLHWLTLPQKFAANLPLQPPPPKHRLQHPRHCPRRDSASRTCRARRPALRDLSSSSRRVLHLTVSSKNIPRRGASQHTLLFRRTLAQSRRGKPQRHQIQPTFSAPPPCPLPAASKVELGFASPYTRSAADLIPSPQV